MPQADALPPPRERESPTPFVRYGLTIMPVLLLVNLAARLIFREAGVAGPIADNLALGLLLGVLGILHSRFRDRTTWRHALLQGAAYLAVGVAVHSPMTPFSGDSTRA